MPPSVFLMLDMCFCVYLVRPWLAFKEVLVSGIFLEGNGHLKSMCFFFSLHFVESISMSRNLLSLRRWDSALQSKVPFRGFIRLFDLVESCF